MKIYSSRQHRTGTHGERGWVFTESMNPFQNTFKDDAAKKYKAARIKQDKHCKFVAEIPETKTSRGGARCKDKTQQQLSRKKKIKGIVGVNGANTIVCTPSHCYLTRLSKPAAIISSPLPVSPGVRCEHLPALSRFCATFI